MTGQDHSSPASIACPVLGLQRAWHPLSGEAAGPGGSGLSSLLSSPSGTVRGHSFISHVISEEENDSGS